MISRYDNVVTFWWHFSSEIIWYQRWWHWFIVAGRTCTTSCSLGRSQLVPAPLLPPPTHPNTLPHLSSSQHYSLSAEDFSGSQAIRDFSWYWSFGKHWVSNANVLLDYLRTATNRQIASASKKPVCQVSWVQEGVPIIFDQVRLDWEGDRSWLVLREKGGWGFKIGWAALS